MLEIKQMFNSGKFMDEQEAKRLEKEYYQLCSYQKPRSNMNEEGLLLSGVKGFGVGTALPMINCINKDDI